MPIYTEGLSDKELLEKVEGSKRILIVGCGVCTNFSLNLMEGAKEPLKSIFGKPYSLIKEIERVKKLLTDKNYLVDSVYTKSYLCVIKDKNNAKLRTASEGHDAVLVMSCNAGAKAVSNVIKDKRVIPGRRFKDIKTDDYKRRGLKVYIDVSRVL